MISPFFMLAIPLLTEWRVARSLSRELSNKFIPIYGLESDSYLGEVA